MKKEYNFLKADKNPYFSKSKNTMLHEKLENLPNTQKNKIKKRTNKLISNQKSGK